MRWLEPELTTPATFQPVAPDDVKAHLKVEDTTQDDYLETLTAAAVSHVEGMTGLTLAASTITLRADGLDCSEFVIPAAPITDIAITFTDDDGGAQTLDDTVYTTALSGLSPRVALAYGQSWPSHRSGLGLVSVEAECGYPEGELPAAIRQAILLIVGDWFANRETVATGLVSRIPMQAVEALLANYRRAYA